MTNTKALEDQGNYFLTNLLLADLMARAYGNHRAAAIRRCAKKIRDNSSDPFMVEHVRKLLKCTDQHLIDMMPGLWDQVMGEEFVPLEES